ncbi:adenosylcobinamide-GDP ribazoletransferase [Sporosarcina sp. Te-1]|uniref:adenosylcobinamide-GDP ribazoletransferase n=1 Tax=Sporosarcina sp. Te-1 TaxID=2818390 RepID=UPI001A9D7599|nr:adenosylcobinamide-GDP ribazoletransferase [Sporosarcina sp. Te-1]QTD40725.1 adenosylcobinamide-GDP ribazoletransferase [Sporosarcina sp. Te-1]
MTGLLLALQFFTSIPVRKELPLGKREVTGMYMALPFIGGLIGAVMFGAAWLCTEMLGMGSFLTAVIVVVVGIGLTGGLHVDGFADAGDAFFSYRDLQKRLEILEDPRIGAFGAMAIVLLIAGKLALVEEMIATGKGDVLLFVAVPFLARAVMNLYFASIRTAKEEGLGHFFQGKLKKGALYGWSIGVGLLVLILVGYRLGNIGLPAFLLGVIILGLLLYRRWSDRNFGGVTGDLAGAFIEGMEALLWLTIIICI